MTSPVDDHEGPVEARHRHLSRTVGLIVDFSRTASRAAERVADPSLVNNSPLAVLTLLSVVGPLRPRELADHVHLTAGGVSNLLARLERDGLVRREPSHDGDLRGVAVSLTEHGREVTDAMSRAAFASLAADEALLKEAIVALVEAGASPRPVELADGAAPAIRVTLGLATMGVGLQRAFAAGREVSSSAPINGELVMIVLLGHGPCRPRWLVDLFGLTSAGVSRLLDRLEHDGFVVRDVEGVESDGRSVLVALTSAGRRHAVDVIERVAPHFDEVLGVLRHVIETLHGDDWR